VFNQTAYRDKKGVGTSLCVFRKRSAFTDNCSSHNFKSAMATAAATGFPQMLNRVALKLITFIMASLAKTADTG
jgi:hypothetical protein